MPLLQNGGGGLRIFLNLTQFFLCVLTIIGLHLNSALWDFHDTRKPELSSGPSERQYSNLKPVEPTTYFSGALWGAVSNFEHSCYLTFWNRVKIQKFRAFWKIPILAENEFQNSAIGHWIARDRGPCRLRLELDHPSTKNTGEYARRVLAQFTRVFVTVNFVKLFHKLIRLPYDSSKFTFLFVVWFSFEIFLSCGNIRTFRVYWVTKARVASFFHTIMYICTTFNLILTFQLTIYYLVCGCIVIAVSSFGLGWNEHAADYNTCMKAETPTPTGGKFAPCRFEKLQIYLIFITYVSDKMTSYF